MFKTDRRKQVRQHANKLVYTKIELVLELKLWFQLTERDLINKNSVRIQMKEDFRNEISNQPLR